MTPSNVRLNRRFYWPAAVTVEMGARGCARPTAMPSRLEGKATDVRLGAGIWPLMLKSAALAVAVMRPVESTGTPVKPGEPMGPTAPVR